MSYSGLAISHSIAHSIGAIFHIPHGLAVGLALPYMIQYSAKAGKDKYLEILKALQAEDATIQNSTEKLLDLLRQLMNEIKEPQSLIELGIDQEKFTKMLPTLAAFASADVCTFTSPRVPTTKEYMTILEYMLKDRPIDF
jgi:1-propanol dehydrogenase